MRQLLANQWVVGVLTGLLTNLLIYFGGAASKNLKKHLSRKTSKAVTTPSRRARIKYLAFKFINFSGFFFNISMLYKALNSSGPPSRLEVMMIFMYATLTLLWFHRAFIQFRGYSVEDWE
jgi:hypothetical protein